ncbi:hypothetical protein [Deinococcus navajonensis]|uniref:Uncharacterized protein n=1 Tax=Deinococcus navajonensis TaxID=309884 RepID=A0ABV8XR54_9DEIO
MEWTWIGIGMAALVVAGSWLARWGERRGQQGAGWSVLKLFTLLEMLLDALPGDRTQVELTPRDDRAQRASRRQRSVPAKRDQSRGRPQ